MRVRVHAGVLNLPCNETCSVFNTFITHTHTLAHLTLLVLIVKKSRVHYAPLFIVAQTQVLIGWAVL